MFEKIKRYFSCSKCHGTGTRTVQVRIPNSELSPREVAEIMVLGGYAYEEKQVPCTNHLKLSL